MDHVFRRLRFFLSAYWFSDQRGLIVPDPLRIVDLEGEDGKLNWN